MAMNLTVPTSRSAPCSATPPRSRSRGSSASTPSVYPKRFPVLNSDTASKSPWSGKLLLSLDGGGVRGYSSLLILQEILTRVAALEKGERDTEQVPRLPWPRCSGSADYPWFRHARPGVTTHNLPLPDADQQVNVANFKSTEHDVVVDAGGGPSNVVSNHVSKQLNAPVDSETPSNATKKYAWPVSAHTANLPDDDLSRFRIHHYFDYVAGTSTGGLSAIMLSRMKMGINEALQQYSIVGNGVFAQPRPQVFSIGGVLRPKYESKKMIRALKKVVENGSKNGHSEVKLRNETTDTCHTAVVAYGGSDVKRPYVFRTYNCPENAYGRSHPGDNKSMAKVWEVARATSAAPRYFSKQAIDENTFIDGGVGCNNPSERIYSEIRAVHGKAPDLIVSIGTGTRIEDSEPSEGIDDAPQATNTEHNEGQRYFDNARSLFSTARKLAHIVTESKETHEKFKSDCHSVRIAGREHLEARKYPMYFRFNVPGIASAVELDQWNASREADLPNGDETLQYLENETRTYLKGDDVAKELQNCAIELVRVRRERAETERWERFATHTVYQCPLRHRCGSSPFSSREKLRMHASERHDIVPLVKIDNDFVCLIDHCMETPRLHRNDNDFIEHLKDETHHDMKDPTPKSTSQLEDWLDDGRRTENEIPKHMKQDQGQSNDTSRQPSPSPASGAVGSKRRRFAFPGRERRDSSMPSERNVSTSDSQ